MRGDSDNQNVVASIRFQYVSTSKRARNAPDTNLPEAGEIFMGPHDTIKIGRDSDPVINHYYIHQPSVSRTQLEFYTMIFDDGVEQVQPSPQLGTGNPQSSASNTSWQTLPPAIYVRDRMSSNGTWIDDKHRIGDPSCATPGYLLRHGQRVSILGDGYTWVFQLHQPATANLHLPDEEMRRDNERIESLLGYRISGHELGSGNFGSVYSAIDTRTQKQVVCKVMKPGVGKMADSIHRRRWLQEIDLMKQLNHFNVLSFLAAAQTPTRIYYFAELASGGDLMTYLQRHAPVSEMDTRLIMRQIVRGVVYLHSKGVIHRDLKPENVLFATYPKPGHRIVIADLGSAGNANRLRRLESRVGTALYNAPEIADMGSGAELPAPSADMPRNHTPKVDTWAIGIIALLLLTGGHPLEGPASRHSEQAVIDFSLMRLFSGVDISEDGSNFVHHCLRVDPEERLTDREAVRHPWFSRPAEDVRRFEMCDREALGGWKPRRHICPMIEDLYRGRCLPSPYPNANGVSGLKEVMAAKKAAVTATRQQRNNDTPDLLVRKDGDPPSHVHLPPKRKLLGYSTPQHDAMHGRMGPTRKRVRAV